MNILIIGCSNGIGLTHILRDVYRPNRTGGFTCVSKEPNDELWQAEGDNYLNLSAGAFGNKYITGRLLEWVYVNGKPDYVFLQYSGLNRLDVNLPKDTIIDYEFRKQTEYSNWIASGGINGSWLGNTATRRLFPLLYDTENHTNLKIQNLLEIQNALNYLDINRIPYNWCTYYDYKNPPNSEILNDGMLCEHTLDLYNSLNFKNKISTSIVNHITETNTAWMMEDNVHWIYEGGIDWLESVHDQCKLAQIFN